MRWLIRIFVRWVLPVLILGVGVGGFFALQASKPEATALETREQVWPVALQNVELVEHSPTLTLYGRVESPQVAELTAAVTADVGDVQALEGRRFNAGALLVTLDDQEATLVVEQRRAEEAEIRAQIQTERDRHSNNLNALNHERRLLELSRSAVARAEELAANNVGSQSQLDTAREDEARQMLALENRQSLIRQFDSTIAHYEAQLARAEALTARAVLDLSRTEVKAPFAGRVSRLMVSTGDRVSPGQTLLNLIDISRIEIRAQIPSAQLPRIRSSLTAGTLLPASSRVDGRVVVSRLDRLSGEIELGAGGVDGLFAVTEDGDWLQLGRTIELVLTLPPESGVVLVPLEAIYGNDRVYKLVAGRMQALRVDNLGETRTPGGSALALIRSPELETGDRIIITQLPNAVNGLRVRPVATPTLSDSTQS